MIKICKQSDSNLHKNGEYCEVIEYPLNQSNINIALVNIHGRYPETGYAMNTDVDELLFIQQGAGNLTTIDGDQTPFTEGDAVLVPKGDKYYFDGDFTAVIACNPTFTRST